MMMLDLAIVGTALGGSAVAAAYDLKTTEVPDWVFYTMLVVGIPAFIIKSFLTWDWSLFGFASLTGLSLLGIGYLMYRTGMWGGADMVLLSLIGFLMVPVIGLFPGESYLPFGVSFFFNLFVIGAAYMIVYAIVFSLKNAPVRQNFKSGLVSSSKLIAAISVSCFAAFSAILFYLAGSYGAAVTAIEFSQFVLVPVATVILFFLVYRFAKSVENVGFKRQIPVSKLRVGDMLLSERKLIGISQSQILKIKRSGKKTVWIKDGVRFIPAFPMALIFTMFVGDALFLIRLLF